MTCRLVRYFVGVSALFPAMALAGCSGDDATSPDTPDAATDTAADRTAPTDASAEAAKPDGTPSVDAHADTSSSDVTEPGYSCSPACGPNQMCCPEALKTHCVPATSDGCKVADLTIDQQDLEEWLFIDWRYVAPDDCTLLEQCVSGTGWRRLLRFTTTTPNIGTAPIALGRATAENDSFEYSQCHDHFHFLGYANYALKSADGKVASSGHKQSFCLEDINQISDLHPDGGVGPKKDAGGNGGDGGKKPDAGKDPQRCLADLDAGTDEGDAGYEKPDGTVGKGNFDCDNQGISPGWADTYDSYLDCQWVDITDVPKGSYQLTVAVNPEHRIIESRYDNNELTVSVSIEDPVADDPTLPCPDSFYDTTDCGWKVRGQVRTCTPGERLALDCGSTGCDTCDDFDQVGFRVCPEGKPCVARKSLPIAYSYAMDPPARQHPEQCVERFDCPSSGQYLLLTRGDEGSDTQGDASAAPGVCSKLDVVPAR